MTRSGRNNEIDILRFVFSLVVVAFHCNLGTGLSLCCRGNIAVEFFLVTSGYFMARSVLEKTARVKAIDFLKRRLFSFYPIWVAALILYLAYDLVSGDTENIAYYISDLFLLHGFTPFGGKMAFGWYLSVLMIDTAILFPCLTRVKRSGKYKSFLITAAVIDFVLIAVLFVFSRRITDIKEYIWIIKKIQIRGMCGILMGVVIYLTAALADRGGILKRRAGLLNALGIVFRTAVGIYLLIFMNIQSPELGVGEFIALGCMGIIVLCAVVREKILNERAQGLFIGYAEVFCQWAGELSLYIYIFHRLIIDIVKENLPSTGNTERLLLVLGASIAVSFAAAAIRRYLLLKRKPDK